MKNSLSSASSRPKMRLAELVQSSENTKVSRLPLPQDGSRDDALADVLSGRARPHWPLPGVTAA